MTELLVARDALPADPGGEPFVPNPKEAPPKLDEWEAKRAAGRGAYLLRTTAGWGAPVCSLVGTVIWLNTFSPLSTALGVGAGLAVGYAQAALQWRTREDLLRRRLLSRELGVVIPDEDPSGVLPAFQGAPRAGEGSLQLLWKDAKLIPNRPVFVEVDGEAAGWIGRSMAPLVLRVRAGDRLLRARVGGFASEILVRVPDRGHAWMTLSTRGASSAADGMPTGVELRPGDWMDGAPHE